MTELFLGAWFLASLPFAVILGRFAAAGDLTARVIVPREDEQ